MTWNVVHNFPASKDTYQVPVDYPTVGYDTIIALWFTDVFTSILANQDALLDLIGKVLLLTGGTMTGDLIIEKENALFELATSAEGIATFRFRHGETITFIIEHNGEEGDIIQWIGDLGINAPGNTIRLGAVAVHISLSDIEVLDKTKGLILRSPNNSRFRIEVSDGGVLSTEAL